MPFSLGVLMKININDLPKVLNDWTAQVLMPKSSMLQQGLVTFVLLQGQNKIKQMLEPLKFLADENGNFELEELHNNLGQALAKMNGVYTIPFLNYNFDKADLDQAFDLAKRYAK